MKVRDSGMPDEQMWDGFFDPASILARLGLTPGTSSAADLGCGYGTFTIPASSMIEGTVHGFDIEPEMIKATASKAESAGLANVQLHLRDFVAEGTGLPDASVGFVMLFNILHAEDPERLLREAHRILAPGGTAAVMHWLSDRPTPRGPSLRHTPKPGRLPQVDGHGRFRGRRRRSGLAAISLRTCRAKELGRLGPVSHRNEARSGLARQSG
jgi:SAM-dependent methyltransferase